MPRFMIQVDHEAETSTCNRTVQVFLATGTHYLTHADWGCVDGVHSAWMVVEVATRDEARAIVPPVLRARARVVALNRFGNADLDRILALHGVERSAGEAEDDRCAR